MKQRTHEEIESKVAEIWIEDAPGVEIDIYTNMVKIKLSQMYESPSMSFSKLMELAEFFDTKNINDDDRFSYGGCKTCDYGSSYGFTLTVRPEQ